MIDRPPGGIGRKKGPVPISLRKRALLRLELFNGIAALTGGLLLVIKPDGSLLRAKLSALAGSPFSDWRVPGILLTLLVGCGFLSTWEWQRRGGACALELSILAGLGLIGFEAAELAWIGFQPLEAVFGVVGLAVVCLALSVRNRPARGV